MEVENSDIPEQQINNKTENISDLEKKEISENNKNELLDKDTEDFILLSQGAEAVINNNLNL